MPPSLKNFLKEFFIFGLKQARACIFAGSFFVILFLSHHIDIFGLPRYDLIFLASLLIQAALLLFRLETLDEFKVICLFHVIGFALEVFKTHPSIGSWSYPEFSYFKIMNVPLYSGFMYAAVGSYIAQAWKIFRLKLIHPPSYASLGLICLLIYLNFFAHHFLPDVRYLLMLMVIALCRKTYVEFTVIKKTRKISLVLSFFLIAFFIWIAENISTFLGAWKYPNQISAWSAVSFHKVGSWSLLVIISFVLIAYLKEVKLRRQKTPGIRV